jgi:hypothetical protein
MQNLGNKFEINWGDQILTYLLVIFSVYGFAVLPLRVVAPLCLGCAKRHGWRICAMCDLLFVLLLLGVITI